MSGDLDPAPMLKLPTVVDVMRAAQRITAHAHRTPVITSATLDKLVGRKVFVKCENLQKTGSFKVRGALNALYCLKERGENVKGVVTHSSGNHGQALAYAAQQAGVPCTIVVPEGSSRVKIEAIKNYGAEIVTCESSPQSRLDTCTRQANDKQYHVVSPYDHHDVIAGQGTIALELMEQVPDLDAILVPVSGGGMVSGIAIAAKAQTADIKVFAVEPAGKELEASLRAGERLWKGPSRCLDTIADALRMQQPGELTFEIMKNLLERHVFTVTDQQLVAAMKFCFQRMKLVVEPSSGAGISAVLHKQLDEIDPERTMQRVAVIMCGGNVDITSLPW